MKYSKWYTCEDYHSSYQLSRWHTWMSVVISALKGIIHPKWKYAENVITLKLTCSPMDPRQWMGLSFNVLWSEKCVCNPSLRHFNFYIWPKKCIITSGGPLSALTCCVNVRLLSAIKKISPLIYSQSWVGSWVYTTQAMMTFTLIF